LIKYTNQYGTVIVFKNKSTINTSDERLYQYFKKMLNPTNIENELK